LSLAEQHHPMVEAGSRMRWAQAIASHAAIVGDKRVVPIELIAVLQDQAVLSPTAPAHVSALNSLLLELYMARELQ